MGDKKFDNPQSANLTKVLEDCRILKVCQDQIKEARTSDLGGTSDLASRVSSGTSSTTSVSIYLSTLLYYL